MTKENLSTYTYVGAPGTPEGEVNLSKDSFKVIFEGPSDRSKLGIFCVSEIYFEWKVVND